MPVTRIDKDLDAHTFTLEAEFAAPVEKVWELWADPRKLERWWGPPTYPATVVDHDLSPGGVVSYFMTSPEGEKFHGWWRVVSTDPPAGFVYQDGFGDPNDPPADMPVNTATVTIEAAGDLTRMKIHSVYPSAEDLAKVIEMGMEEGIRGAVNQADDILAGS